MISVGFVAVDPDEVRRWLERGSEAETVRHDRIDTVIESTSLKSMYEVHTEHDFTDAPALIPLGSSASLLGPLAAPCD